MLQDSRVGTFVGNGEDFMLQSTVLGELGTTSSSSRQPF